VKAECEGVGGDGVKRRRGGVRGSWGEVSGIKGGGGGREGEGLGGGGIKREGGWGGAGRNGVG